MPKLSSCTSLKSGAVAARCGQIARSVYRADPLNVIWAMVFSFVFNPSKMIGNYWLYCTLVYVLRAYNPIRFLHEVQHLKNIGKKVEYGILSSVSNR